MKDLYLKSVEFDDLNLLKKYNQDFKTHFPDMKLSITEDTFEDWLISLKDSQIDKSKTHLYPYWLMKGKKAIGLPILKTNIEVDEEYKKYGGHISYIIAPSYRMKGYGTHCLHLVLKECEKIGLNKVFVNCDERNIGSFNVIENNYGELNDTCVCNSGAYKGRIFRRYLIDINQSLKYYELKKPKKKAELNQICNLNRSNLEDLLINNMQSEVGEQTLNFSKIVSDIKYIEDVSKLYKLFLQEFEFYTNNVRYKRFTEEIIKSRVYCDSNDACLVLSVILRLKGVPVVFVSSVNIDCVNELQHQNENECKLKCFTFLEIYLNDKWYLFDTINGKIYNNYDYNNLSLPNGYYAYRKTLNNYNFGAYSLEENNKIIYNTFKKFDSNLYKEVNYECIDL